MAPGGEGGDKIELMELSGAGLTEKKLLYAVRTKISCRTLMLTGPSRLAAVLMLPTME